jgi:hypothetical protein
MIIYSHQGTAWSRASWPEPAIFTQPSSCTRPRFLKKDPRMPKCLINTQKYPGSPRRIRDFQPVFYKWRDSDQLSSRIENGGLYAMAQ